MADKPLPWFRLYPELLSDPKIMIASNTMDIGFTEMIGTWISILCIAGMSPVRGSLYVTLQKRYSNKDVATMLHISNEFCDKLLELLLTLDMLELDESGAYRVKNWEKRQYKSDNSTERVTKWRKNKKESETLQQRNDSVSASVNSNSFNTDYLRIFSGVTGMLAIPGNDENVYLAINQLKTKFKSEDEIISYLKPYFQKWIKTKSKEGKLYSKTNNAWLTTYAIAGEMPGGNGQQQKARQVFK